MIASNIEQINAAKSAADCVCKIHESLSEFITSGISLSEINDHVKDTMKLLNCKSAFIGYSMSGLPPYPSHCCLSKNDCIVHGTHLDDLNPLNAGDLISIDIGVKFNNYIGDAAWTYAISEASNEDMLLMEAGKKSLKEGIKVMIIGKPLLDWARKVEEIAQKEYGFDLIKGFGGHGYGTKLHDPPFISNVIPKFIEEWPEAWKTFQEGMLLAVEPMLAAKKADVLSTPNKWPIKTLDGSQSVHYEANILITSNGPENLTKKMFNLPDILG